MGNLDRVILYLNKLQAERPGANHEAIKAHVRRLAPGTRAQLLAITDYRLGDDVLVALSELRREYAVQ